MEISLPARGYNSFGGNKHLGLIGEMLTRDLGSYGDAVQAIEVIFSFVPTGKPRRTLEDMHENFKRYVADLPKVKFSKTKRRVVIEYRSNLPEKDYLENYGPSTPELIAKASAEVLEALRLADDKVKRSDFEVMRFHADVAAAIGRLPSTTEGLTALSEELEAWRRDLISRKDPWDLLDIDWKKYHPRAREILDDVFYWDCVDDIAPHGNDTGADLLEDFRRWNKRNPATPAYRLVLRLMEGWGFQVLDPREIDPAEVLRRDREHEFDSTTLDEALIAAAFAAIKLRGNCDHETQELAICAIEREVVRVADRGPTWVHSAHFSAALKKLKSKLLRIELV